MMPLHFILLENNLPNDFGSEGFSHLTTFCVTKLLLFLRTYPVSQKMISHFSSTPSKAAIFLYSVIINRFRSSLFAAFPKSNLYDNIKPCLFASSYSPRKLVAKCLKYSFDIPGFVLMNIMDQTVPSS